MFFVILIIIVAALIQSGHAPDQDGWIMLTGLGWMAGYLDCRRFSRSDQDKDRVMPPDAVDPIPDDSHLFEA